MNKYIVCEGVGKVSSWPTSSFQSKGVTLLIFIDTSESHISPRCHIHASDKSLSISVSLLDWKPLYQYYPINRPIETWESVPEIIRKSFFYWLESRVSVNSNLSNKDWLIKEWDKNNQLHSVEEWNKPIEKSSDRKPSWENKDSKEYQQWIVDNFEKVYEYLT